MNMKSKLKQKYLLSFFTADVESFGLASFCLPNPGPGLGLLATAACVSPVPTEKRRELWVLCVSIVTKLVSV